MSSSIDPSRHPIRNAPVTCWRAFNRLTQLSFPRSYPIVQFPNAPLILAFASGVLAQDSHGLEPSYAQGISYLAMATWAYLELFSASTRSGSCSGWRTRSRLPCTLPNALHHR